MGGTGAKIRGKGDALLGLAQQGIGSATGSERLEAEGQGDRVRGAARGTLGDAKNTVGNAIYNLKKR